MFSVLHKTPWLGPDPYIIEHNEKPVAHATNPLVVEMKVRKLVKAIAYTAATLFALTILLTLPLRWINPPTTSFILQYDGDVHRGEWIPYEDLSPYIPIALVAAEDQKFPFHHGFDFESISKVLDEEGGPSRGASTISQQLAKNLYLWPGRTLIRKGIEAYFTVLLELFLPKERILEIYLNVVEFGRGVYGISAASEVAFGTTPHNSSAFESALLIAVLPNPKLMSPNLPSDYVISRAAKIEHAIGYLGGPSYLTSPRPDAD